MKLTEKFVIGVVLLAFSLCFSYASAGPGKSMTRKGSFEIEKVRDLISDQRSGLKSEAVRGKIEARINSLISGKMKRSGLRGLLLKEQIVPGQAAVRTQASQRYYRTEGSRNRRIPAHLVSSTRAAAHRTEIPTISLQPDKPCEPPR